MQPIVADMDDGLHPSYGGASARKALTSNDLDAIGEPAALENMHGADLTYNLPIPAPI
ncbi:hypothetical protein ACFQAT_01595 [Undibacterium arcticum]|uniref:hypothetical protein n=1 Tax=Undibacterium arcticum TaxID=1762892 RepID=UPI003617B456